MRRFGLIGFPLTHSFSKRYFTKKFEEEGITGNLYELFQLQSIHDLKELLDTYPDLAGFNITIPYKKQVLSFLHRSEIPEGLDACNCVRIDNGQLTGFNTDITGFEQSLMPLLQPQHTSALVLGNGGAAESVVFVLKKNGIAVDIVSRNLHGDSTCTYSDLTVDFIRQHRLIINTTPLGTFPETEEFPDIPYEGITSSHLLYDLVYNPPLTRFLQKGQERGARIKNGEEMLVIQAEESWKIWNRD